MVLGLTPDDLDKLKLDNIDIIAALGKWKEWSNDQVRNVCDVFNFIHRFRLAFLAHSDMALVATVAIRMRIVASIWLFTQSIFASPSAARSPVIDTPNMIPKNSKR